MISLGGFRFARLSTLMLLITATLAWATSARAVIVVNDTWTDTTRNDPNSANGYSENGTDIDTDGSIESSWFYGGSAANGSLNVVAPGGGAAVNTQANRLRLAFTATTTSSAISQTSYFTPTANPVTLANPGDKISVTWVFTPTNVTTTPNSGQNLRFALVDWQEGGAVPTARFTTDVSSNNPASGGFAGYAMFMNFGTATGRATPYQLLERNNANSDLLSGGANWAGRADATGFGTGAIGYFDGQQYTFTFSIERNALNGLDIASTMTGTVTSGAQALNGTGSVSVSFTDSSPNSFVYDTSTIRPSGATTTAQIFDTSLFKVEFTSVPEGSAFLLVGMVGLSMVAVRRVPWSRLFTR